MHISIIVNGSNDLYYSLKKSVSELISNLDDIKNVSISVIYSLIKSKSEFWTYIESADVKNEVGYIEYKDGCYEEFLYDFKNENTSLDVKRAIKKSYKNNEENILIVSGHGGPFQCMLDMSGKIDKSYNTYELCLDIREQKYELVVLDMCAMNFIEVLNEIFITKKVKSILTYKGLAPFDGINYLKFIQVLVKNKVSKEIMKKFEYPFIYLENSIIDEFTKIKRLKDILVKKCVLCNNPDFEEEILEVNKIIDINVYETKTANKYKICKLNYIKYFLEDEFERVIYAKYLYTQKGLWKKFLLMNDDNYDYDYDYDDRKCEYIELSEKSLDNIITLHNPLLSSERLKQIKNEYYKMKRQE